MNKSQYAVAIGARPFADQSRGFIWASSWLLPVSKRASRPRFAPSAPPRFPNPSHKRADDENPDFPPLACTPVNSPSVRPPTSSRRPQGGLPCIERTRDAHGRSNVPRPLQSRFETRKKPEGYTSTPTGLKRLRTGLQRFRTQITTFHVNENGKGTPSGVPQPIHKRKLILVEEEFDASSFGGRRWHGHMGAEWTRRQAVPLPRQRRQASQGPVPGCLASAKHRSARPDMWPTSGRLPSSRASCGAATSTASPRRRTGSPSERPSWAFFLQLLAPSALMRNERR